jgi:hypothetical protein
LTAAGGLPVGADNLDRAALDRPTRDVRAGEKDLPTFAGGRAFKTAVHHLRAGQNGGKSQRCYQEEYRAQHSPTGKLHGRIEAEILVPVNSAGERFSDGPTESQED